MSVSDWRVQRPTTHDGRRDARTQQIVSEAVRLFDASGYDAVDLGAIADAGGIRKPTLYYFSNKEEILTRVHDEFITLIMKRRADGEAPPTMALTTADVADGFADLLFEGLGDQHEKP